MYKYAAADSIFDGVSNIYLVSIATAFLAVIVALYCSNILKDESEKQCKELLSEENEENVDEEEVPERDDYLNVITTKIENHYQIQQEIEQRLHDDELENASDYEHNDSYNKCNFSTNNDSDDEFDSDEIQTEGLVSKLKSKRFKELESQLTRDQLEEEKKIEREQLAAIFELLRKQEAELNMKEIDESELNAQLSLYR